MEEVLLSTILQGIFGSQRAASSYSNNQQALAYDQFKTQQAQQWATRERNEAFVQAENAHLVNQYVDPQLSYAAYRANGMSESGAAMAASGVSGGFSPSVTTPSAPVTTPPNLNTSTDAYSELSAAASQWLEKKLTGKKSDEIDSKIILNAKIMDDLESQIRKRGNDMKIDNEKLDFEIAVMRSQAGKNWSEAQVNYKRLDEIASTIQLNLAKIDNLDAQTINEYIKQSLYEAQTDYYQTSSSLNVANVGLVEAQTEGQNIENIDKDLVVQMRQMRVEASRILACDVDADLTTQFMMSAAFGNYVTMNNIIHAGNNTKGGLYGTIWALNDDTYSNFTDRKERIRNKLDSFFSQRFNHGKIKNSIERYSRSSGSYQKFVRGE